MNIGIDYDDTITRDPNTWFNVISLLKSQSHKVFIVTARYPATNIDGVKIDECYDIPKKWLDLVDGFYATGRQAKAAFILAKGISIHVWIDDNPRSIYQNNS
jgi:hypothetical protein